MRQGEGPKLAPGEARLKERTQRIFVRTLNLNYK